MVKNPLGLLESSRCNGFQGGGDGRGYRNIIICTGTCILYKIEDWHAQYGTGTARVGKFPVILWPINKVPGTRIWYSRLRISLYCMAGLGLFFHLSVRALRPRVLLRSAYDFLCLIYTKSARASWKVESARAVLTYSRSYTQKTFSGPPSGALVMPFSIQKPSQKHKKLTSIG